MKLNEFAFSFCVIILISCMPCLASQLPKFVQKYHERLPHLEKYVDCVLSNQEKAQMIVQYCCQFIPKKPDLIVNGVVTLENKLFQLMEQEKQISLVLLGFPFKSTNHEKKCLSAHVDLGEYLSLLTLNSMVHNIQHLYPKVQCTIISDGLSYHVEDYDPAYDEILEYHAVMERLTHCFSRISFVSWKINENIASYADLQQQVLAIPLPLDEEFSKGYKNEMKTFVTKEFDCALWQGIFFKAAEKKYQDGGQVLKEKKKQQEINRLKNELMETKMNVIVAALGSRGKQYSTFVSTAFPDYQDSIRLSVHCNKNDIDISKKIPISLVYGSNGTPWHNAVVVDEKRNEVLGLFKDCFTNKKASFLFLNKKSFEITNSNQEKISLQYIAHNK